MSRFIQRNPCQPKAVYWKRYTGTSSIGKRTIYVATPTLGFEIDNYPQTLTPRQLYNGTFKCDSDVEYVAITSTVNSVITPTKAVCLIGKYYIFNAQTQAMDEVSTVEDGITIVQATTSDVIRFEKNAYVKKTVFDCSKENDQQSSSYQPIQGLIVDSTYQTLKTHNFCDCKDEPREEDLIYYQGRFWIIEDTRKTFIYAPREKSVLHLSIKQLKK